MQRSDLAYFGGEPAFKEKLYVGCPNIGNRERFLERVNDILDRRWLTNNGKYVQEFEQKVAEYLGVKHCIATCNGTVALELVIRALELKGEVIMPSFTFVATAHALQWQEITPVFCDIDPKTHTIDPERVKEMITPRTSGIIGVHVWGQPCAVEALQKIADERGLKLMFDASHAFGCSYKGQMIGSFGEAEVFSFHATKFINSFEGGMIATNNDELDEKLRLMRNFGFAGMDNVVYLGTNGKMSEVSAAMGLTSLESIEDFINTNQRNYHVYENKLKDLSGIRLFSISKADHHNYQYVVLEVHQERIGMNRDLLLKILHAEHVIARRYFYPGCHQMQPYKSLFPHSHLLLKITEVVCCQVLILPTGTATSIFDIEKICNIIKTYSDLK